jgi:hypothetical protein
MNNCVVAGSLQCAVVLARPSDRPAFTAEDTSGSIWFKKIESFNPLVLRYNDRLLNQVVNNTSHHSRRCALQSRRKRGYSDED